MGVAFGGDADQEQPRSDDEQDGGTRRSRLIGGAAELDGHVFRHQLTRAPALPATMMNATMAAAVIRRPAAPMRIVETTPSAAIAPSTARIGPMQQATHATAAMPRIDATPEPDGSLVSVLSVTLRCRTGR